MPEPKEPGLDPNATYKIIPGKIKEVDIVKHGVDENTVGPDTVKDETDHLPDEDEILPTAE